MARIDKRARKIRRELGESDSFWNKSEWTDEKWERVRRAERRIDRRKTWLIALALSLIGLLYVAFVYVVVDELFFS